MGTVETTQGQIIKLGLLQRLDLLALLPAKASFVRIVIIDDIKEKISIKQKDIVDFKIKELVREGKLLTSFHIDNIGDDILEFNFTDMEVLELKNILNESSKKELITSNLKNLCRELQIK